MSILDKHPAPWTWGIWAEILDVNKLRVIHAEHGDDDPELITSGEGAKRLILAAPELLAALRGCYAALRRHTMTHEGRADVEARAEWERAESLIARIEGGE
jgi:hypothetical protein